MPPPCPVTWWRRGMPAWTRATGRYLEAPPPRPRSQDSLGWDVAPRAGPEARDGHRPPAPAQSLDSESTLSPPPRSAQLTARDST